VPLFSSRLVNGLRGGEARWTNARYRERAKSDDEELRGRVQHERAPDSEIQE